MDIGEPSRFWHELGEEHRRDLSDFGFERFKRHQALRYFSWRWRWRAIGRSEQFRFLLGKTSPQTWARCAMARTAVSDPAWTETGWSAADRWLYCFAVRLLWSYAERHGSRSVLELPEPLVGGPFPVELGGRLISQDLANTALEVATLLEVLEERKVHSILEVGAGYGRVAYALLHLYPRAICTIVDIEPAIDISRWYLTQLFPPERLRFLSLGETELIPSGSVDLALSISSLQEMTPKQVAHYLELFDRVAVGGMVFLKQWASWRNTLDGVTMQFDRYPIPPTWEERLRRRAPVQTAFIEAAWHVPSDHMAPTLTEQFGDSTPA